MNQPKTYFLAPDFDCPPETAIKLGQIIAEPSTPYESLNADDLIPVPSSLIISTSKTGFTARRSQVRSGKCGIWAQLLEGAYGGGVGFNVGNSQDGEFSIDEVETTFIKPSGAATQDYLRKSLESEGVRGYLEGSRFRKSVFIIVGLKIAKGAKVHTGSARSKDGVANLMVDGTGAGLPVKVGPEVEAKVGMDESMEWKDEKSFVFAYRLRKVTCKKGKLAEDTAFNKGAFLDGEKKAREEETELHYLIEDEDTDEAPDGMSLKTTVADEDDVVIHPINLS
ncbi:hypothetical protein BKA64DRAFT_661347 [Cadophora sp. MPI-SDFR-AT-0126]|nr:hypothetical protein BKA64DRAFT_661347 [Leotiomycetes sp. MPI-SDFR-AT-0126]